jgi:hypothetical protein
VRLASTLLCRASVKAVLAVGALLVALPAVAQQELVLVSDRDNTLYETDADTNEVQNEFSNGAGSFLFAGRTRIDAGFRLRRGLLRFDLQAVPAGSTILFAELTLYQSSVPQGAFPVTASLHRVLEEWGEGASDAIPPEGQGALALPGDATWYQRVYDTLDWTNEGGTFSALASAAATLGLELEDHTWTCTPDLVADVQAWVDDSDLNFGWIIIGGEEGGGSARRFNSRENNQAETRPRLRVIYRTPEQVFADGFESQPVCD